MELDDVLEKVGEFGKYQRTIFVTLGLAIVPLCFNTVGTVFLVDSPDHWCYVPELNNFSLSARTLKNLTIPIEFKDGERAHSQCRMYDMNYTSWTAMDVMHQLGTRNRSGVPTTPCKYGWQYDTSEYTSTVVMQWDLVCDNAWLAPLTTSIYMAGCFTGVILFGAISDWIGRRKTLLFTSLIQSIVTVACAFSPNLYVFCAIRFIIAMTGIGTHTTAYVIGVELVGRAWRVKASFMNKIFWTVDYLIAAGIAYLIRDWFRLQLVFSSVSFLCFVFICIVPESPRWLYTQNRWIEGDTIIKKAANVNRKELPENLTITVKNLDESKGNISDLVRTPTIRGRTFNLIFHWFVICMVYYGLSLNTSNLGGNRYINFAIAAAMECPGILIAFLVIQRFGRRIPLSILLFIGGTSLLLTSVAPYYFLVALGMIGKCCISGAFAIIYIYSAELFPTVVRNVGLGVGSSGARFGAIVAPYFLLLASTSKYIPLCLFGGLTLVAGLCTLVLPETKGKRLMDTIAEAEAFGRKLKSRDSELVEMKQPQSEETKTLQVKKEEDILRCCDL